MQGVDEGLVFAESEGHFSTKEIVGLVVVFTIHGIAVFHKEIDVGIVFATEDGTIVCQIAVAHTDGTVEGECLTVVVQVVGGPHAPCFARDDAVQTLDGIDDGGCCLTQESRETIGAVVENDVADAVCHLSYADASHGCSYQIVDGWRFFLACHFPHERSKEGVGSRLPEVEPTASCGIVVEVAVVGMAKRLVENWSLSHTKPLRML